MFRTALTFACAAIPFLTQADEPAEAFEPERLQALRDSWTNANERDSRPIKSRYLTALEGLKETMTKQDRLGDALLVRDEIERLTQKKDLPEERITGPTQLVAIRKTFESEIEKLLQTNQKKYVAALKSLKSAYSSTGELEPALAVQREIDSLATAGVGLSKDEETLVGKWSLVRPNGTLRTGVYMELHDDGSFEVFGERQWSGRYRFLDREKTKLKRTCNNGTTYTIRYDKEAGKLLQDDGAGFVRAKE